MRRQAQYGATLDDVFNRTRERSKESYTPKQRFVSNFVYEVPVGRGRAFLSRVNRVAEFFAGGWNISGIAQLQSGLLFTPGFSGFDAANTNVTSGRPDRIADGNLAPGQRTLDRWFDASAFVLPPTGRFGNSGGNVERSSKSLNSTECILPPAKSANSRRASLIDSERTICEPARQSMT